jgi:hypothetical protein
MMSRFGVAVIGLCVCMFAACATEPLQDESAQDDSSQAESATLSANDEPADTAAPADISAVESDAQAVAASNVAAVDGSSGGQGNAFLRAAGGPGVAGFTCLWQNNGFGGERVCVRKGFVVLNLTQVLCAGCKNKKNFNDDMSSWKNSSGAPSCWWFNTNRGGTEVSMPNGVAHSSTAAANNDQASSFGSC